MKQGRSAPTNKLDLTEDELDAAIEHFVPKWNTYSERVSAFDRAVHVAFLKEGPLSVLDIKMADTLKLAGRYMKKHGFWRFKE